MTWRANTTPSRLNRSSLLVVTCLLAIFSVCFIFNVVQPSSHQNIKTAVAKLPCSPSELDQESGFNYTSIQMKKGNHTQRLFDVWDKLKHETYKYCPNFFIDEEDDGSKNRGDDDDDVTLVLHLGVSKWARLLFSLRQWKGPMSIAIFLNSRGDLPKFVTLWEETIANRTDDKLILSRANFHLMVEWNEHEKGFGGYPFNYLRDLALQQVRTKYFLTADVDFVVPSLDTYDQLRNLIRDTSKQNHDVQRELSQKTFFVLPAIDMTSIVEDEDLKLLPTHVSKQDVLRLLEKDTLQPFHLKSLNDTKGLSYAPTNYSRWAYGDNEEADAKTTRKAQSPFYFIEYGKLYEPYVLGETSLAPPYFVHFRGPGLNKASWFVEANCAGFKFAVLRDFFMIHLGHGHRWAENREENLQTYRKFKGYLSRKYESVDHCIAVKIRPPYTYLWWTLFVHERDAVKAAGFNETSWDRNLRPPSLQYSWDLLNETDRKRMALLGYDNKSWSETSNDHRPKAWVWD